MLPSRQGFETNDSAGKRVELWLVMDVNLSAFDCSAELIFQCEALASQKA